ncbi:YdbC family protein [Salipaludibacillus agaradhaerens]|uniref:YdbC family protein n=1 Tax=Salipaludibacillus agaradhaerens TaxID=76935 RepID=UPI000996EE59|nr:PC4/YdbC family ssDNA-binding protein [Salipaludibacillus agaradhaerens]
MADIKFEIVKHIGELSESPKGWKKELNLISWNNREPKYDVREWSPDHQKMGKGLTFTEEELKTFRSLLNDL